MTKPRAFRPGSGSPPRVPGTLWVRGWAAGFIPPARGASGLKATAHPQAGTRANDPLPGLKARGFWGAHATAVAGRLALYLASYLYGSIPVVYLLGRGRGVDLRRLGSGNVGGSNLWAATGLARGLIGWIADASKGYVPVALGRRLGLDERACRIGGVCGLAGQCWPLFLRFQGGRGISAFLGAALASNPRAWRLALVPMITGSLWRVAPLLVRRGQATSRLRATRSRSVPLGCAVALLAYPVAVARDERRHGAKAPATLLTATVALRRLTAPLPDDASAGPAERPIALLYRLLYDRNTRH